MRDPRLVPWDYPEYFAMLRGEIPNYQEDDDYGFDDTSDVDLDAIDGCNRCRGRGCNWCLMTDF